MTKHRPSEPFAHDYAQNFTLFEGITPKSARKLGAVGGKIQVYENPKFFLINSRNEGSLFIQLNIYMLSKEGFL